MTTAKYAALMVLLGFIVGCEGRQTEAPPELHQAAKTGDVEKCTALLAAGADVNAKDRAGRTALHEAVESRHVDVVKLFLAHGANVNATSDSGETVMGRAIMWQDIDCVTLLADNGADLNMKDGDGFPPLQRQMLLGEVMGQSGLGPIGRILIEKGANIHARDPLGQTALECAIAVGTLEEVEFLLAKGADVNEEGSYPLAIAAEHDHQDVFDLLLAKGARIDSADTRGQ